MKHKGARLNPGMSAWEWLGLGTLAAIIGYAIFKPTEAEATIRPAINPVARPVITGLTAEDRAAIRGVQDRLRAIGYQPGPSTGEWNHDTNFAIANFQRDELISPADGVLNGLTALRLVAVYERKLRQQNQGREAAARLQALLDSESTFWSTFTLFRTL